MHSLILFGRDPHLLDVRRLMLEREQFCVITIEKASSLNTVHGPVDLLVFCHTASRQDCENALSIASVRWPAAQRLFLVHLIAAAPWVPEQESFSTLDGPEKLIVHIQQILRSRDA